jgi:ABC-type branched-subunit amino acid transport system substrate-binding protein
MRRLVVLAMLLPLLAAACGGHDTSETAGSDGETTTTGATDDGGGSSGEDAAEAGAFGTIEEPVCGPGDASGETDQGVTDDAIQVGTTSDPGNTIIPGLLQELFDASEAFVAWCNDAGGINGREIELTLRDTKLVEGQQRITEACAEDFALIGGGSGLDATIAQPRVDCGLPQLPAFLNDPQAQEAGLQVQAYAPFYPDYLDVGLHRLAAERFPDQVKRYAYLYPDLPSSGTPIAERYPPVLEDEVGYDVVYENKTPGPPATVDNWRPYVDGAREAGGELFEYRSTPETMVPLMATMQDVGYTPDAILLQANNYDAKLIEGNDALADIPVYVASAVHPFEDTEHEPTQQFLEIMDASIDGWSEKPAFLAVPSFSAWLLFAQAAKACGSELTRECLLEEATAVDEWDAGGLQAPIDPDPDEPKSPPCLVMLRATTEGFEIDEEFTQANSGIYRCSEDFRVRAPG